MLTRQYHCNHCGYEFEHEPEPSEPYAEQCPACLAAFRPVDTDSENEAA